VISIIIPTLNEFATLPATLAPLQPLRGKQIEIIIADGGSCDHTLNIARNFADTCFSTQRGRARQMNAGAAKAKGEILLFLHSDSQLPANAINMIEQHSLPNQWGRFDVNLNGKHWLFSVIGWLMNHRSCLTGIVTGDQGLFLHRTIFEKVGGFSDIPLMEDIAISKQLRKYSRPICLKPKITVSVRYWEQHGVWRSLLRMWWLRLAYFFNVSTETLAKNYYR
jgi:rSAM/selenodomain-associated transferase 2